MSALQSGGTATFADTPVHAATTAAATVTATRTITVTGAGLRAMAEPDPFTITRVTVTHVGGGTAGNEHRQRQRHPAAGDRGQAPTGQYTIAGLHSLEVPITGTGVG